MSDRSSPSSRAGARAPSRAPRIAFGSVAGRRVAVVALSADVPGGRSGRALTAAESDVAARLVRGESYAAIAAARGTSARTVANQARRVLAKVGARSRFELPGRLLADGG